MMSLAHAGLPQMGGAHAAAAPVACRELCCLEGLQLLLRCLNTTLVIWPQIMTTVVVTPCPSQLLTSFSL